MIKRFFTILLGALLLLNAFSLTARAEEEGTLGASRVSKVFATFQGTRTDVTRNILEVDGDMADTVSVEVKMTDAKKGLVYQIYQIKDDRTTLIKSSDSTEFTFTADQMEVGGVVYLVIRNSSGALETWQVLNFRIHKGEASRKFPDRISSDFGSGLKIDLSDLLPGMEFQFLPFAIPMTFKRFDGGRFAIGLGYNSSDAKFWDNIRNGNYTTPIPFEELRDIALSDENYGTHVTKGLGAVVVVSGWIEGSIYANTPVHGHLQAYVGTGFNAIGQYAILTWEITGTVGAEGSVDLSLIYDGITDSYDAQVDNLKLGGTGGIEAFGGMGLASIFAVGIYGAASLSIHFDIVPETGISDFVVAGQLGFKVKLLGKVIVNFRLISGSYDFVSGNVKGIAYVEMQSAEEELRSQLLAGDYASAVIPTEEAETEMQWLGQSSEEDTMLNAEWIDDADFSRKIASGISPGSQVQIANVQGAAVPQMNVIFLSDDQSREAGNKATLMNTYYDPSDGFLSDPIKVADDGTADFDPYLYHSGRHSQTYLVWKNAVEPLNNSMTLAETADRTEIEFAEFQVGGSWYAASQVTDFAGSGQYATGAVCGSDQEGGPVVAYYTNDITDPAGFSGTHGIYMARREGLWKWNNELIAEVDGSITDVDTEWFMRAQTVAVSRIAPDGSRSLILYQNGEPVLERQNASNGKFIEEGYNYLILTWYEDGRLWKMEEDGKISAMTPEDLSIPQADYKLVGKAGSSGLMLITKSSKDSGSNIYGLYSKNGGLSWVTLDLTRIDEFATIGDIGAAFTYEDEPIVVYSLQNYEINYDNAITDAENFVQGKISPDQEVNGTKGFLIGQDDERFTDTSCDLYIKARKANSHISFVEGYAVDEDSAVAGQFVPFDITVKNTGLYPVDQETFYSNGLQLNTTDVHIEPGETAQIRVDLPLPKRPGKDPYVFEIEVTQREDKQPESRGEVVLGTGHLEGHVEHIFEDGKEQMAYRVVNFGFAEKDATILVRDEDRDVEISRETITLACGETYEDSVVAPQGLFVNDGCTNVTIYVLFEGETEESLGLTEGRMLSVTPLDEAYGRGFTLNAEQTVIGKPESTESEAEEEEPAAEKPTEEEPSSGGHISGTVLGILISAAAVVIILFLIFHKKDKTQ